MKKSTFELIKRSLKVIGVISPRAAGELGVKLFCTPKHFERPPWELEMVAKSRSLIFKNGLHANEWGEKSNPTVLLAHGWEGRGSQMSKAVDPLLRAGFHVIALDGPAHGDSPGKMTNVNFYSKTLQAVVEEIGNVHGIIAHSFGAGATGLALLRGMKVKNIVLVAAPSDLSWVIANFCKIMEFSPRVTKAFYHKLETWAGMEASHLDIAKMGQNLEIRTLVVHDPEDKEVRYANAERLVSNWSNAKLLTLEKVGHRRILKAPEFVEAAAKFMLGQEVV